MVLYDAGPAGVVRVGGRPLELQRRGTGGQRPVDQVGVASNPANVRRTPEDVVVLQVHDPHHGGLELHQVAADVVLDALGLARRARRVEHVEWILRIHLLGLALVAGVLHQAVPVLVAPVFHRNVFTRAPHHDHVFHARGVLQSLVGVLLQRRYLAAARGLVGRDQDRGLHVVYTLAELPRLEGAEDHRVYGSDPRTGKHRYGQLGDHRQVDADRVTLAYPEVLEHVGELADLGEELVVGVGLLVVGLVAHPDQGLLVALTVLDVAVEAVVGGVYLAADEPLGEGRVPVVDLVPLLEPVQLAGPALPEAFVVFRHLIPDLGVLDVGVLGELLRRLVDLLRQILVVLLAVLLLFAHLSLFPLDNEPAVHCSLPRPQRSKPPTRKLSNSLLSL